MHKLDSMTNIPVGIICIANNFICLILVIMEGYTLYGHLHSFESSIKDVLIVITTTLNRTPDSRVITFKNHSDGFNRLYFFNAMQNFMQPNKG